MRCTASSVTALLVITHRGTAQGPRGAEDSRLGIG
ncbi:hypothetical protein BH20ACT7_BH20ACT7_06680 [soil metagenome]|jgi:hypothetical protein